MKPLLICLIFAFSSGLARAESLRIVADIAPVSAIAAQIAGPDHQVSALIPPNASPHDFSLRPSEIKALTEADLILWTGADATPALTKLLTSPEFVAKTRDLSKIDGTNILPLRSEEEVHEDNHHGDDHHEEEDHSAHGHSDPHLWLSPANGTLWGKAIAADLMALNPDDADAMQTRLSEFSTQIDAQITRAKTLFASPPARGYIQYHDAFTYFETAFKIAPDGIATSDDEEHASLGKIAKLRAIAAAAPSICVMISNPAMEQAAQSLMEAPDSRLILAEPLRGETYPALIKALIDSYQDCLY